MNVKAKHSRHASAATPPQGYVKKLTNNDCRQDFPIVRLAAQSCGEPRNRKYGYQYDQVRVQSRKDRIFQIHRIAWHRCRQYHRDKDHTQD